MSGQDQTTPDQVPTPTVSTAPTGGETPPAAARWWQPGGALPDHLGRARTSTVVLSVLFVLVFALYLTVRPDETTTGTAPAGGSSDVEAPVVPVVPQEPTSPEPTEEPAPTTGPGETDEPGEGTGTPTTSSAPTSSSPGTTTPGSDSSTAPGTPQPTGTTGGTTEPATPTTTSPPGP
ncbi:hypothetical protein JKP75_18005 [Blastococcus sp. TML/M2B]|uniref:hypothetical protein n=1 Tax=unclassified Blastococcus TaxID=2619396 RepID=UPI00190C93FA|nr:MULTISPECIES: hypothetical protein [unclassified Blastococcus]MBN1094277.1 hypothetical protein [Blastococcus sp. TML/M2B]MBN1095604.1 hypothetical protein [Blastococcus sp. TML/C7B]